jgi:Fe-S-cluster containining protein
MAEIRCLEQFTALRVDLFAQSKGKTVEDFFLTFKDNGDCYFLDEDNGIYSCRIYKTRPEICKRYPATTKQKSFCSKHMNGYCL